MTSNSQPSEDLPEPQDVQDERKTPKSPAEAPTRPADTEGYDLGAGSQPATRGASGHRG